MSLLQIDKSTADYLVGQGIGYMMAVMLGLVLMVTVYFLPALLGRKKRAATSVFLLNLFLGWTLVGWIGALLWALQPDTLTKVAEPSTAEPVSVADELIKLQSLRDKGALTQDEFQQQRHRLLARA